MQIKTPLLAVLLALALVPAKNAAAQYGSEEPRNILKVNLTSLLLRNVSVQYERVWKPKVSLALGVRVMPSTGLPFKSAIIDYAAANNADAQDIINKSRLNNFAVTPEIRFYLGRGHGHGFYVAPYYRYATFSSNTVTLNFNEPNGPKRTMNLSGDVHAHSGGLLLGAQWFLSHRLSFDWWIAGAHLGREAGSFSGTPSTTLTSGEQTAIRNTIDDVDIPFLNKTVTVTPGNVRVETNGAFGGVRAGINLGLRL